jgi:hypothetical protein
MGTTGLRRIVKLVDKSSEQERVVRYVFVGEGVTLDGIHGKQVSLTEEDVTNLMRGMWFGQLAAARQLWSVQQFTIARMILSREEGSFSSNHFVSRLG